MMLLLSTLELEAALTTRAYLMMLYACYTLNHQLFTKDQKALGDEISTKLISAYKGNFQLGWKNGRD